MSERAAASILVSHKVKFQVEVQVQGEVKDKAKVKVKVTFTSSARWTPRSGYFVGAASW